MALPAISRPRLRALWFAFGLACLIAACPCETAQAVVSDAGRFQLAAGAQRVRRASKRVTVPSVSLAVAPIQVRPGGYATYTVTISRVNRSRVTMVNYTMGGTATAGKDYTLSGTPGQAVILTGARSGVVTLSAVSNNSSTGNRVATMTLLLGNRYTVSSSNQAAATIVNPKPSPTPTPYPTVTPSPTATPLPSATPTLSPTPLASPTPARTQEIWISVRTDGLPGSGTQADPYDGNTQSRFDAVMRAIPPNTVIHLGPGTFRTVVSPANNWIVKPGWAVQGSGMYSTTVQMSGDLRDVHYDIEAFKSPYNVSTDNVVISDLTVDCNWAELQKTATDNNNVGEKNVKVGGVELRGSYNTVERVRVINGYGSWANHQELFAIAVTAPDSMDATGCLISDCLVELPAGNYGSPYAMFGGGGSVEYPTVRYLSNSKVVGCSGVGNAGGRAWTNPTIGFNTGGVNMAGLKDCQIESNTFIDCIGVAYQDTGSCDGLRVANNTVVRGFLGIALVADHPEWRWTKNNIEIIGNKLNIQNRIGRPRDGNANYGIKVTGTSASSNVSIAGNYVDFDPTGQGAEQFLTIACDNLLNATIASNVADEASAGISLEAPVRGQASGTNITRCLNRTTTGAPMTGLPDNCAQ